MEVNLKRPIGCSTEEKRLRILQFRTTPYLLIFIFALIVSSVRLFLMPQFGLAAHFVMFLTQVGSLIGIWHLVKKINSFLDRFIPFEQGPMSRVLLQIALTMLLVGPLSIATAVIVKPHLPQYFNRQAIAIGIVLFMVVIVLFNFGFYAYYFFANWQRSVEANARLSIQAADLEREKFNLQYHQLKNQVNPHYLFNTLTSLDGLIHVNPELASEFVRHMAKVYRYVLQHKENEVVSLDEELEFIGHYVKLLYIRYDGALQVQLELSDNAKDRGIVMVTLQMLIDNAIKHNIAQPSTPLLIDIRDADDYLEVSNNKQLRRQIETSNKQGLKQLVQLYSYITDKPIRIAESENDFLIRIPLL